MTKSLSGRGLSPLPLVIATHCTHGKPVTGYCKNCAKYSGERRHA